jgi:hypothetical protein
MGLAQKIIPLLDRVLVQKIKPAVASAGGILLPESGAKVWGRRPIAPSRRRLAHSQEGRRRTDARALKLPGSHSVPRTRQRTANLRSILHRCPKASGTLAGWVQATPMSRCCAAQCMAGLG